MFTFLALGATLSACGGPVNPDRPPLYDYEPPKIDGFPNTKPPSRV